MMTKRREDEGRVKAGSGSPRPQTVEERAQELALIEHPESPKPAPEDRQRAHEELLGHDIPGATDRPPEAQRLATRNPADPPVPQPDSTPQVQPEDPQKELESAVEEGAREAEHQRMLEERRVRRTS